MSSADPPSTDHDSIEQTKHLIRDLVGEIVQLSKTCSAAEQYYPAVLQRIVRALAAVGGAVWTLEERRGLEIVYQVNLSSTLVDAQSEDGFRHYQLVEYVAQKNEPQLIPPMSTMSSERESGNPTQYLLVMAPIRAGTKIKGVIEILQRPDSPPTTHYGYLRFLLQMSEQISDWLMRHEIRQFGYQR